MKKITLLISLFLWIAQTANAQRPNSFSFDPTVFINEFESYMSTSSKREVKDMAEEFSGYYNAGKFTNQQKVQMIKLCNEMLNATFSSCFR